jgi:hypothetical protein
MTDREILEMIARIQKVDYKEEELADLLDRLKVATGCPKISDLIFYGEQSDTPDAILKKARQYRPIEL